MLDVFENLNIELRRLVTLKRHPLRLQERVVAEHAEAERAVGFGEVVRPLHERESAALLRVGMVAQRFKFVDEFSRKAIMSSTRLVSFHAS